MVRVPAWWRFHQPAGSQFARTGAAVRRIPVPDITAYNRLVTVDLGNDGIAPVATFNGFAALTGSVTSAAANSNVIFGTVPAGTYTVPWTVTLSGTLGAADTNNFSLYANGVFIAASVNPDVAGSYVQTPRLVAPNGGAGDLKILTGGTTPTAGSTYAATLGTVAGGTTAQVGPSAFGESWSLDQCYLSTSAGPLDPSQCTVFVGPLPVPQYAVTGSLAGGGSQFGMGGVGLTQGWFVWAVWTGGTGSAQAYLRVTGTKTVLTN